MKQIYLFLAAYLCLHGGLFAQNSPYVSQIYEYKPAPGQFINTETWGSPAAAQSLIGGLSGHVSLGGYGGSVVVGFDHAIENDPSNPFGVDFTIFGNAFPGWSEPGIVSVMKDENNNGLPDDTWYELKGSDYDLASTAHNHAIMYANPGGNVDVPWRDSRNETGVVKVNAYHTQPYYPSSTLFPAINPGFERYSGTMVSGNVNDSNPSYIQSFALDFGYADNRPKQNGDPTTQPDNPETTETIEGAGGDAMKIEWAIDANGTPVELDKIHFIRIQTSMNRNCGWLGEISTEICGIVDVATTAEVQNLPQHKQFNVPAATTYKVTLLISGNASTKEGLYSIINIFGEKVKEVPASEIDAKHLQHLDKGIYQARPASPSAPSYKIIIE